MKTLTIFTPAYNRAHTIGKTYRSLCRQTSKDFEWLVIDDGSTDNTEDLVKRWTKEADFLIRYIYQENQGMHGAHNTAYRNIHTELNTCIDSDDYMPDDAVETIISFWNENKSEKYAGFIGLDCREDGSIIGSKFNETQKETTLTDFYASGGSGDKKIVYRTDIIRKYPEYPLFEGERYVGLAYKYMLIDRDYKMLTLNKPLVIVEYQTDGSSHSMYQQYWHNPQGFAFYRKTEMIVTPSVKRKFMSCIHYVSSSIIARNRFFIRESPLKFMTILSIIPGALLYVIINYKVKHNKSYSLK